MLSIDLWRVHTALLIQLPTRSIQATYFRGVKRGLREKAAAQLFVRPIAPPATSFPIAFPSRIMENQGRLETSDMHKRPQVLMSTKVPWQKWADVFPPSPLELSGKK